MPKILKKKYLKSNVIEISLNNIKDYIHEDGYLSHNCSACIRVYLDSDAETPKVYSLSELLSNGTNYGKKQSDFKGVVGATHPNCRGLLLQLPDGWGFIKGSQNLKYYGPDFLWVRDKDGITN